MDGVLLVDKPAGITSAEVVRRVKTRVKPAKTGHLGTLDPFATGLLPILVGEATKLAPFLETADKEYQGTIAFGAETDTLDADGKVVRTAPLPRFDDDALVALTSQFVRIIEQVPPVFSAIKLRGVPMYKLARRGEASSAPPPRSVRLIALELQPLDSSTLTFRLVCSPGTYVRALARDIGLAVGSAAYLASLRRLRTSGFSLAEACSLDETLAALESGGVVDIVGMRQALAGMTEVDVSAELAARVRSGNSRDLCRASGAGPFKVVCSGKLVAIARASHDGAIELLRVFNLQS